MMPLVLIACLGVSLRDAACGTWISFIDRFCVLGLGRCSETIREILDLEECQDEHI